MQDLIQVFEQNWRLIAGGTAVLVAGALLFYLWRRRRGTGVGRAMRSVSVDALHDILLPDGMGGQIHLAHLLLTARGLVVIDIKRFHGTVFGSDRMDEWTVIAEKRRFTFPNPQSALYDRMAALRQVARDVPVAGHVVFDQGADFSKGRPRDVLLPAELLELYKKPSPPDLETAVRTLRPQWDRIKETIRSA